MKTGQKAVGHPVDVATGTVYSTHLDISLPGQVDLEWQRRYSTALLGETPGPLGPGWAARCFASLTRVRGEFRFVTPEGDTELFADPQNQVEQGLVVRNLGSFQELVKNAGRYVVTRWDVASGEVERFVFKEGKAGETWPLASIEDETGQGLDMVQNHAGRLIAVRQRLEKRTLAIGYTPENRVESVSLVLPGDKFKTLVRYEYDKNQRLCAAYDALGRADRYEYDGAGRMTREIKRDGGVYSFRYDEKGRCIKTSGLDHYDEKTLRYRDHVGWTEVANSLGHVTLYNWTPAGQVVCEVDPLGRTKRTEYDEYSRIVAAIPASGAAITYGFDERGNQCKVTDAGGEEYHLTFNDSHLPLTMRDPAGRVWKRVYDAANKLIRLEDPLGRAWTLGYDARGNPITVTDPLGATRRRVFSDHGTLLEETDGEGNTTRFVTDPFGRITKWLDATGAACSFQYDPLDNVIGVDLPDGSHLACKYDAGNNAVVLTNGDGTTTKRLYGTCGRLLEETNPLGHVVKYRWGTEPKQLKEIINENGETFSIEHNEVGQVILQKGFDGTELRVIYNEFGSSVATVNGAGERIDYQKNHHGLLTKRVLPDGSVHTFTYDILGNLTSAVSPSVVVEFERDALGNVVKETQSSDQGSYVVSTEYDAAANRIRTKTSLGLDVTYELDRNGLLSHLTAQNQFHLHFRRNGRTQEVARFLPGGLRLDQRYDVIGHLCEQQVGRGRVEDYLAAPTIHGKKLDASPGTVLVRRAYEYDKGGNLTSIKDGQWGAVKYVYDAAKRLLKALRSIGVSEHFSYDKTGNLESIARDGSPEEKLEHVPGGQPVCCGNTAYVHDDAGRLIKKIENASGPHPREWLYTWDAMSQLTSVTTPNGETWKYSYDPLGRRIAKEGPGKLVQFVWDKDLIVHQLEQGALHSTWLFNQGFEPLCKLQNGTMYSVIPDHLGTPMELVDASGKLAWSARLRCWGELDRTLVAKVDCPIRFPGQWHDEESGLHYNRFRYYDPKLGRFLCPDPIGLMGGLNAYAYAPNPVSWIDPFGLAKKKKGGGGGGCGEFDGDYSKLPPKVQAQINKQELPTTGEFPFKPKLVNKGGEVQIEKQEVDCGPRGMKTGYVDQDGNVWIKNYAHNGYPDHWDVQKPGGGQGNYDNIGVDGNLNKKQAKPAHTPTDQAPKPGPPPPPPRSEGEDSSLDGPEHQPITEDERTG